MPPAEDIDVCAVGAAGFAMPFGPNEPTGFLRNETLYKAFEAAYKLLFAMALRSLLMQSTEPQQLTGTSMTL